MTIYKGIEMNWDQIEGNWKQLKGNVKEQWGKLTDDQLDVIAGKQEQLAGKIQETYGVTRDAAHKQVTDWMRTQKDGAKDSKYVSHETPKPDLSKKY